MSIGGNFGVRELRNDAVFDANGLAMFPYNENHQSYLLALLNTKVIREVLRVISSTMAFVIGDIKRIPVVIDESKVERIKKISDACVKICRTEWDSFETSWDFKQHPFITYREHMSHQWEKRDFQCVISGAYKDWEDNCEYRFNKLKANEEELNRIFIDIYGMQDELTPEVEDKDVTVRKADLQRDIKSFISYAVGCMLGRYSLDEEGLVFAGGEWDESRYKTFKADKDGIIPICDDEYFDDDIVNMFVQFVEVVYGKDTLEENLRFIADTLGGKGASRDVIRNYFLNDFYADHCKIYQKRPIYWLFDSGKKNGFKCLIYIHRYQPDTIARIRTDYVHEQQSRYRTAIADLEQRVSGMVYNTINEHKQKYFEVVSQL